MASQTVTEHLRELAETVGVSTGFWDWYGNWKHVQDASLVAVLNSLGFSLSSEPSQSEIDDAFRHNEDLVWLSPLPPTTVCRQGNEAEIPVHVPHGMGVWCHVETEDGQHHELEQLDRWISPRMVDGNLIGRATFKIPNARQPWLLSLSDFLAASMMVTSAGELRLNCIRPAQAAPGEWGIRRTWRI